MKSLKKYYIFLINGLLFAFLFNAFFFESVLSYFFCSLGFFLNCFLLYRRLSEDRSLIDASNDQLCEPNLSEKNLIMEDLDREAARRREFEQFTKN